MADIKLGTNFKLYYNKDTGNSSPQGIGNVLIDELAAFPVLTISSETSKFDTYDSDYVSTLLSDMTVEPMEIVVNYIPTDPTHQFLDQAALDQTEFQLILVYSFEDGEISYAIVNGSLTAFSTSGDKDSAVQKTYTFNHTQVMARSMAANALNPLYQGDYGVGSDGVSVNQYVPDVPTGNSFIKIPSTQAGNPASADMMGIGLVDNGSVCEFAITKSGTLSLFAKNASTAWTRIYTVTQMDSTYVPLTRTVNGKPLSSNVVLSANDLAGGTMTGDLTVPALTVTGTTTASTVNAESISTGSLSVSGNTTHTGTTTLTGTTTAGTVNASTLTVSGNTTHTGTTTLTGTTTAGTVNASTLTVSGNTTHTGTTKLTGTTTAGTVNASTLTVSGNTTHTGTTTLTGTTTAGTVNASTLNVSGNTVLTGTTTAGTVNASDLNLTNALPISSGGTASNAAITAAYNIGALPIRGIITTAVDLNSYGPTSDYIGRWNINGSPGYTSSGLPEQQPGIFEVHGGGGFGGMQTFLTRYGTLYQRTLTASWDSSSPAWGDWNRVGEQPIQGYITGDLNTVLTPGTYSIVNTATNMPLSVTGILEVKLRISTNSVLQRFTSIVTGTSQYNRTWQRTLSGTTWSTWAEIYTTNHKPTASDVGAVSISGDTMTGTLNGTAATYSGTVTGREVNTTYRITQSRTDNNPPYITWNRTDQVNGTLPSAITQVGFLQAMLTGTDGGLYDRSLGQLSFWYDTNGGGVAYLGARNASASTTSQIKLDGVNALATITGNLSATGTIDRTGSGTLSFNANRTNSNANSYYGAQTTAGQIFFGTGSGSNFVVNNSQSNSGAWLTLDGSTATFSGSISAPSLALTTALPVSSGGTGNANGTVGQLTTARTFITNLASTSAASFNGTANNSHGVTGILPIANGGTGSTTIAALQSSLGVDSNSAPSFKSLELFNGTPYIDFHYQNTTDDYSVRLINSGSNVLTLAFSNDNVANTGFFQVEGSYRCRSGSAGGSFSNNGYNLYWNNSSQVEVWVDTSRIGAIGTVAVSDKQLKKDIEYVDDSNSVLDEVLQWKPASFKYKARGIIVESDTKLGFIANDLVTASPDCVTGKGLPDDYDIEADPNNPDAYQLDQIAMIAKLTMALQEQQVIISTLQSQVAGMATK